MVRSPIVMNTRIATVRLSGAVALALAASLFGVCYSAHYRVRMEVVHDAYAIPHLCQFMNSFGWLTLVLPVLALLVGILTLRMRWSVGFEIVLVASTVLAASMVLLCLVAWQIASIPVFSGGQWHY